MREGVKKCSHKLLEGVQIGTLFPEDSLASRVLTYRVHAADPGSLLGHYHEGKEMLFSGLFLTGLFLTGLNWKNPNLSPED